MSNKLLVYFSYTGNTRIIAKYILEKLNCDVLELHPKDKYSENYQEVVDEYQSNESGKKICELMPYSVDLSKYDTLIIGSSVWWYTITPVIRTFLKQNSLAGKTVIPFATNAGWIGKTFKEIKELCSDSDVKNEMNIIFTENYAEHKLKTSSSEIDKWLKSIYVGL